MAVGRINVGKVLSNEITEVGRSVSRISNQLVLGLYTMVFVRTNVRYYRRNRSVTVLVGDNVNFSFLLNVSNPILQNYLLTIITYSFNTNSGRTIAKGKSDNCLLFLSHVSYDVVSTAYPSRTWKKKKKILLAYVSNNEKILTCIYARG
jgi:hypothetical protein